MKKWFAAVLVCLSGLILVLDHRSVGTSLVPGPDEEVVARPSDWLFRQRAWPSGVLNDRAVRRGAEQAEVFQRQSFRNKNAVPWTLVSQRQVGGRISDLHLTPDQVLYAGTPSGGLWRSNDLGTSWSSLLDTMPSLSIGTFDVAPSNPQVIYAGSGDAGGSYNSVWYQGAGVFKSTDGGSSWLPTGLKETSFIARVAIHPGDANHLFVAAMGAIQYEDEHRGLYRSKDGGLNWEKVLFIDNRTGAVDVVIDPQNPNRIYAATWERQRQKFDRQYTGPGSGLYRSLDGGDTWERMTNGLPESGLDTGRFGLAMAPSNPDILYSVYANQSHELGGVFKSVDGGDSWTRQSDATLSGIFGGFGWFFCNIRVHPRDPETVYLLGVRLFISTSGGSFWRQYENTLPISLRNNPDYRVHVDYHDLIFSPQDPSLVFVSNDGGLYRSQGSELRFQATENPPNAIFYTCEIDPSNPERFLGGLQDNGTQATFAGSDQPWEFLLGGDGFEVQVQPQDSQSMFMEYQYGGIFHIYHGAYYDIAPGEEGERYEWKTPLLLDPNNPNTLFVGSQHLWMAEDIAPDVYNFVKISPDLTNGEVSSSAGSLTAIEVAPSNSQVIYVGTNDANVWVTEDRGQNWRRIDEQLPQRWVTRITADPRDAATAYVTFSGYYDLDYQPHILVTHDMGQTWQDISANLPQAPINDVVVHPKDSNTLFVATEFGVYFTTDGGASWRMPGVGLPLVTVLDLDLHEASMTLAAATYGRSMYRLDLNKLEQEDGPRGALTTYRYGIAEVQVGAGVETQIGIVNPNPQAQTVMLFSFDGQGHLLAEQRVTVTAMGKQIVRASGALRGEDAAWIQVGANFPLAVYGRIFSENTDAAWIAATGNDLAVYMPHVARDTGLFQTQLATANTSDTSLEHMVRANLDGPPTVVREHRLAYGQATADVRQYLGSNLADVSFGLLEADGPGAVSMELFTKLPERDRVAALGLDGRSGNMLHFLHIALDKQLFWSGMVYLNPNPETATVEERYFDVAGSQVGSTLSRELVSGEKITLLVDQNGSGQVPEGASRLEVRANRSLVGYELFGSSLTTSDHFFAGLQGNYDTSDELIFPYFEADQTSWTGLVVVNLGDQAADLSLILYGEDGLELERKTIVGIPSGAKQTLLVNDFFQTSAVGGWVKAQGENRQWAGFQLWGDHHDTVRRRMAGFNALQR